MISEQTKKLLLKFQQNEITEHYVYGRLARLVKDDNQKVLQKISNDEKAHYEVLKKYTGQSVKPNNWLIFKYYSLSKILGITFAVKLMERGEELAQEAYNLVKDDFQAMNILMQDEHRHEKELLEMIKERRLEYMGSIVLGLNDALVELTGALAGLSFALQNTKLIALAGLITGIAASFSMAASEYLSKKHENDEEPLASAVYTGLTYIFTVLFLVFPYLILSNYIYALVWTLINAVIIIFIFTYFNAVTKGQSFKKLFTEMFLISMGVAAFSFVVGAVLKMWFNIDV